jgi:hypothetical protein
MPEEVVEVVVVVVVVVGQGEEVAVERVEGILGEEGVRRGGEEHLYQLHLLLLSRDGICRILEKNGGGVYIGLRALPIILEEGHAIWGYNLDYIG